MSESSLIALLQKYLVEFHNHDTHSARNVRKVLRKYPKELDNDALITWWKSQDVPLVSSLQSYMFWLWTNKKIEYQLFENTYESLTPILSRSWSMPIEITTGLDSPLIEGGFLSHEFSIFQYKFSPANHSLAVVCQEYPPSVKNTENFDLVLDFLSFLLDKYDFGYLGFRQNLARKQTSSERATIVVGFGSEIRQDMIDLDFGQLEDILAIIESKEEKSDGLSMVELLRIRHRAVLDSSLESKIITLWSAIEAQWGEEDKQDFMLSNEDKDQITKALAFLGDKLPKVKQALGKLKNKTKNDKITDEINEFDCVKGWDVGKTIRRIHELRGKFAHGGILRDKDVEEVKLNISFMMQIFDELISKKLLQLGIAFGQPKS